MCRAARRRLPIGIQTFSTLREQDCYCVDKTADAQRDGVRGGGRLTQAA